MTNIIVRGRARNQLVRDWRRRIVAAAALVCCNLASCVSPEQLGAQNQTSRPQGHGVAIGSVQLAGANCTGGVIQVGQLEDGLYMVKAPMWGLLDQRKSGLAFQTMAPGTYEVVSVMCGTTEKGLVAPRHVSTILSASPPTLRTVMGYVGYEKGLASFTIGPDEIVNVGTIEVRTTRVAEGKAFGLIPPVIEGGFRIFPDLPSEGLAIWKRLHPEWGQKLVSRAMVPRP